MAKSACTCGNQILWKADEPQSDGWFLVATPDLPDDRKVPPLATRGAFCSACGRLWVAWGEDNSLTEYVPTDPDARPTRGTPLQ